jgi:hypothetical protein
MNARQNQGKRPTLLGSAANDRAAVQLQPSPRIKIAHSTYISQHIRESPVSSGLKLREAVRCEAKLDYC